VCSPSAGANVAADVSLSDVQLLTPIRRPGKIICVGRNYRGHVAEARLALPEFPSLFVRVRESLR
jgi:2-keto-4-pentenoate hydratase/2-oxohepta-3-ene-1,7-dioic acid hydratase in catechol pathway